MAEAELGFGSNDPHVASAKNNLAEFYRNIGRYDDAEHLYLEVILGQCCLTQATTTLCIYEGIAGWLKQTQSVLRKVLIRYLIR